MNEKRTDQQETEKLCPFFRETCKWDRCVLYTEWWENLQLCGFEALVLLLNEVRDKLVEDEE